MSEETPVLPEETENGTGSEEDQSFIDLLGITPLSLATTILGIIMAFIGIFFIEG
jgi:hypothetical protein